MALWKCAGATAGVAYACTDTVAPAVSLRVAAAIRIAGRTVQATLVDGEAMEIRIAATTRKLTPGATLEVSI